MSRAPRWALCVRWKGSVTLLCRAGWAGASNRTSWSTITRTPLKRPMPAPLTQEAHQLCDMAMVQLRQISGRLLKGKEQAPELGRFPGQVVLPRLCFRPTNLQQQGERGGEEESGGSGGSGARACSGVPDRGWSVPLLPLPSDRTAANFPLHCTALRAPCPLHLPDLLCAPSHLWFAAAKRLDGSDLPREPFFRPGLWQNDLFLRT